MSAALLTAATFTAFALHNQGQAARVLA